MEEKEDIRKSQIKQGKSHQLLWAPLNHQRRCILCCPEKPRDKEEKVPPPPPYSVEELYTAVRKNAKGSAMEEEDGAPQIPPHTIEDLYTAMIKKPKVTQQTLEPEHHQYLHTQWMTIQMNIKSLCLMIQL